MQFPQYPTPRKNNNLPSGFPICTVVSYNSNGDLIPCWFGVVMNDERYRYKILAINSIKPRGNLIIFECKYEAYDQLRIILLQFDITNHRWTIA